MLAARAATTTIPIVFFVAVDPIQLGLVTSLSRPGGNLTGVVTLNVEVAAKRLQLLHELVPTATIVALLVNPTSTALAETTTRELETAARTMGLEFHVLHASSEREIDTAFATLVQLRAGALVIGADALFNSRSEQLAALTIRHRVPAIYQFREFVSAGGLMAYGSTVLDTYRPLGVYTGRILKGEKPADLPVQQATKVELVINMKTAKALGLSIPMPLIGVQRDFVISLANRHRLPNVYAFRYYPANGGLASYGVDNIDLYKRAASYIDRILKGEKPANLPVQLANKYELVINMKTAKALGLDIPVSVLARTDEVIE